MVDSMLTSETRNEISGSKGKRGVVKLLFYAVVFLAGLGALTISNMSGHPIAALFFMVVALGGLALFLGALRSES